MTGEILVGLPTLIWFATMVYAGQAWLRAQDAEQRAIVFKRLFSVWFLYCIPIHGHGLIPMIRAEQMSNMAAYPDMYFGAYPDYCRADPRYCAQNALVMTLQGGTALFTGPLCAISAWGMLKDRPWRYLVGSMTAAIQGFGTLLFFLELSHGPTAIPSDNAFDFYFAFLFMNSMWLVFPILFISAALRQLSAHRPVAS